MTQAKRGELIEAVRTAIWERAGISFSVESTQHVIDAALSALECPAPLTEMWALLYLHDWDPPKEDQEHKWEPGKNVFPEIHAAYNTLQEAVSEKSKMGDPDKYWIRRFRIKD